MVFFEIYPLGSSRIFAVSYIFNKDTVTAQIFLMGFEVSNCQETL